MKKTLISSSVTAFLALLSAQNVLAAVAEPEPPAPPPAQCNITFATGAAGKGYSKYYANYAKVCPQVPTCEKTSEGGLENLSLLIAKEADVGLADVFTLMNMLDKDDAYKGLQVVASLHNNLLHVLTLTNGFDLPGQPVAGPKVKNPKYSIAPWNKEPEFIDGPPVPGPTVHVDIGAFSHLKGKPVGLVGSAQFIVRKLDSMAGHGMVFTDYDSDAAAIAALKSGKVQGVMTMAAWPHGVIDKMKPAEGIKLVNYDLQATAPLFTTKKGYKNLGQYSVQFLGTPNVLLTRPFTPGGENARLVASIRSCIATNLQKLKDTKGFEPAWSEVNDMRQTFTLPAFLGQPAKK